MKRFFHLSGLLLCVGLIVSAFHPIPVQGKSLFQSNGLGNGQNNGQNNRQASGQAAPVMGDDTPENRLRASSVLLQDEGPIADGGYTTVDYPFTAQAGETVVVYWEALGSKVALHDSTSQAIAPMPYALPNLEFRESSNHHAAFRVRTTGEHRLSFVINGYDNRSSQRQDPRYFPRYFIRVRPASEVERLMAESMPPFAETIETSARSQAQVALRSINHVIEQRPELPQPYLLRVLLTAQLASSDDGPEGYTGQSWQLDLYDLFRAQSPETQALIIADFETAVINYETLAAIDDGFFTGPVDLEIFKQSVILLETGVPSAYLEDAFFNAILPTLIF